MKTMIIKIVKWAMLNVNTAHLKFGVWPVYAGIITHIAITAVMIAAVLQKRMTNKTWKMREMAFLPIILCIMGLAFLDPENIDNTSNQAQTWGDTWIVHPTWSEEKELMRMSFTNNIWRSVRLVDTSRGEESVFEKQDIPDVLEPGESIQINDRAFTYRVENTSRIDMRIKGIGVQETGSTHITKASSGGENQKTLKQLQNCIEGLGNVLGTTGCAAIVINLLILCVRAKRKQAVEFMPIFRKRTASFVLLIILCAVIPRISSIAIYGTYRFDPKYRVYTYECEIENVGYETAYNVDVVSKHGYGKLVWKESSDAETPDGTLSPGETATVIVKTKDEEPVFIGTAKTKTMTGTILKYAVPLIGHCAAMGALTSIMWARYFVRKKKRDRAFWFWLIRMAVYGTMACSILVGVRIGILLTSVCAAAVILAGMRTEPVVEWEWQKKTPPGMTYKQVPAVQKR